MAGPETRPSQPRLPGITTRNCSQIFGRRPLAGRQTAAGPYWSRPRLPANGRRRVVCCSIITVLPNLPPLCSLKLESQEINAGPGSAPLSPGMFASSELCSLCSLFSDPLVSWDMIPCSGNCCGFILQAQIENGNLLYKGARDI